MFRIKDFILMDVVDIMGKKIGFIKDVLINFHKGEVIGFQVSSYKLFQKNLTVLKEDIIAFSEYMITKKVSTEPGLVFSDIKEMDILNGEGEIVGMLEDILFQEDSFKISGVVASLGFIKNFIYGKKILLIDELLLGEEYVLQLMKNNNIELISKPHMIDMEVECHEENL